MKTTQNNTLFSIINTRTNLEGVIEELGGELTPELEEALRINQDELSNKGESYIFILENLLAAKEMNKRYKEKAEENIRRIESTEERLKSMLLEAAKRFGKFEAGIHTIGTRASSFVVIDDENELPEIYTKTVVKVTPDKKAIADAIKAGAAVPGAHIESNLNLRIS